MLIQISVAALLAFVTAIPIEFAAHPIVPVSPSGDTHGKTLNSRDGIVIEEVVPGVYICTGEQWRGNCYWEDAAAGYCHRYNLGSTSSFGPDSDLTCELFTGGNCEGVGVPVVFPGFSNGLFRNVQSWRCN